MAKVKVATAWLDSCSGCHMSLLDLDEALIGLADKLEFGESRLLWRDKQYAQSFFHPGYNGAVLFHRKHSQRQRYTNFKRTA